MNNDAKTYECLNRHLIGTAMSLGYHIEYCDGCWIAINENGIPYALTENILEVNQELQTLAAFDREQEI